jgi:CTP:molybdopterin cytidylyltransferase MocA
VKATYKASLLAITGETGCRRLIKENPEQVLTVEMESDHVVRDVDTIEAYNRLVAEESR